MTAWFLATAVCDWLWQYEPLCTHLQFAWEMQRTLSGCQTMKGSWIAAGTLLCAPDWFQHLQAGSFACFQLQNVLEPQMHSHDVWKQQEQLPEGQAEKLLHGQVHRDRCLVRCRRR